MALANTRIIHAPGQDVLEMLTRRMPAACRKQIEEMRVDAVGLVQANIVNVLYFSDIAQKAAAVYPVELNGSCPQHIVGLAVFGEVAAVETAMQAIERMA